MPEFMQSWTFMIIMAVLLIVLVGLLFYLRNQREEE